MDKRLLMLNLQMFNNTNKTTDGDLSVEMKTYYSDYLIDNAEPELIHDQFAQVVNIPQGSGKTVEFRKYTPLMKALTPITEGVTPDGNKLKVTNLTSTVKQYGDYIEISDILILSAIDNNVVQATNLLASQAGRTLDTITREVLVGGTSVQYGENAVTGRHQLVGGANSGNHYLTVKSLNLAARFLKTQNARKIDGYFAVIAHPDTLFDLKNDKSWIDAATYSGVSELFRGEIGRVGEFRVLETTEAKIFHAEDLASDSRNLRVNKSGGYSGAITSIAFDGGTVAAHELKGRKILLNGVVAEVTDNTTSTITVASTDFGTVADDTVIYGGEAGANGRDIYATLVLADNAYGTTALEGGGLQHIVKQLGSAGTSDPLNQRATVGWKATKTAERLVETYMLRIETASTFESGAN